MASVESFFDFADKKDMGDCMEAIKECRDVTIAVMREHGDIVPGYAYGEKENKAYE